MRNKICYDHYLRLRLGAMFRSYRGDKYDDVDVYIDGWYFLWT